jgi:CRP-like cAMP-binding protein
MVERDFFVFCSSLKRPELRAIGELSWVRHLAEGEVLYQPGDPGNALFIVNRGVLEMLPEKGPQETNPVYLSRGEVIGDVEAFSDLRRMHLVRAREVASVQCFPRSKFGELARLVPSFFLYLCEQMACRVVQADDLAKNHDHRAPLSGRISHFDLSTVHQTIANSGQTGELKIRDDEGETIGAFYFESGRPASGQFQHLTGEEAYWQLFLNETLSGTFSFSVGERPLTNWIESGKITRTVGDMLIVALQYRDEFDALKKEFQDKPGRVMAITSELHWNGNAPPNLRPVANQIWELVSRKPATINELYRQCSVCELKVYHAVHELLAGRQIAFAEQAITAALKTAAFA